ncbi:MAG: hypothetical protein WBP44_12105 [Gammaproteobacteria bacterium]
MAAILDDMHRRAVRVEQQGSSIDASIGIAMDSNPQRKPFPCTQIRVPLLNSVGSENYAAAVWRQVKALEALLDGLPPGSAQKAASRRAAIILTIRTTNGSRPLAAGWKKHYCLSIKGHAPHHLPGAH